MNTRRIAACAVSLVIAGSALGSTSAMAAPSVSLDSAVFIERQNDGNVRSLEPASKLARGDRVVTVVTWYRMGGDGGFTVTNPLPRAIAYQNSSRDDEEVSVDGGRTWGQIGDLRIGNRMATPEDVTHVRWRISPGTAAQGSGRFAYSGIVR